MKRHIATIAACAAVMSAAAAPEILERRALPDGDAILVVRDDAGRIYKQRESAQAPVFGAPATDPAANTVRTFYEGFEGYRDIFGLNWIPEGWTEINTDAHRPTEESLAHNVNNTWYTYYTSEMYQDVTTDGEKEAFIHFGYNGDFGATQAAQDEWLITPAIKLDKDETLHFIQQADHSEVYNWDNWDYSAGAYTKRELICNMKVMVTADDGATWDCLWDMERDIVSKLTDEQCMTNTGLHLRNYDIDLSAYSNREVKIAFRYLREDVWGGNSMIIDGVTIDHPESSGITDIEGEDSDTPAEYFNLQGMRVAQPEAGNIYIRRTGSKAEKVLVK